MERRSRGGAPHHVTTGHYVRPVPSVVTPDTLNIRSQGVAQGAGEGGGAQVGVVDIEQSEMRRADLQWGTGDQATLWSDHGAPAGVIPAHQVLVTVQSGASGTVKVDTSANMSVGGVHTGIGDQRGAGGAGHGDGEAAGQPVLGHTRVHVTVLQLGVDDAQPVVGVPLTRIYNPACKMEK